MEKKKITQRPGKKNSYPLMSEKRETQDISSNKISRNIPCMGSAIDNAAEDCAWKAAETGELSSQTISSNKVGEKLWYLDLF